MLCPEKESRRATLAEACGLLVRVVRVEVVVVVVIVPVQLWSARVPMEVHRWSVLRMQELVSLRFLVGRYALDAAIGACGGGLLRLSGVEDPRKLLERRRIERLSVIQQPAEPRNW